MDSQLYKEILDDLEAIGGLSENDKFYHCLSQKYKNIPEQTLRSIIALWYQRKVSKIASETKEFGIYEMYKKLRNSGVTEACQRIAKQLNYPSTLIAKIVLTSYVGEVRAEKNKNRPKEVKSLRKQQCCYCTSQNSNSIKCKTELHLIYEDVPPVKRHDDPRVELALNLFGEDDVIGKHILEKFKFSSEKPEAKNIFGVNCRSKYKNFLQTSEFVEMGEKNVMKYTDVQKLFAKRLEGVTEVTGNYCSPIDEGNVGNKLKKFDLNSPKLAESVQNKVSPDHETIVCEKQTVINAIPESLSFSKRKLNDTKVTESPSSADISLIFDENISDINHSNTKLRTSKVCDCSPTSDSDGTDTDSAEDSDDAYEYYSARELLENTSLIEDPVLAIDVFMCTLSDDQYGPASDIIANSSGVTYEKLLEAYVREVGLPYKTENKLRGVGVDKTPDIILLVPVSVDDFAINWIESKALFADLLLHQDFKKNQFKNYINRFGPGLILYWHGYTDNLPEFSLLNKQIMVRDRFPSKESFKFMDDNRFRLWMQSNTSNSNT